MALRIPSPLLIALYGPTASGKTPLSIELAHRIWRDLGTEPVVISADSRQVYKYMDIGTSKTMPDEMQGIRHEMIDVTEPVHKLELRSYVRLAKEHITECFRTGMVPMVVGGTGVYVGALLADWDVERIGATRESLQKDFPRSMAADAFRTLRRLQPRMAARVHPNNYEGIINALARAMTETRDRGGGTALPARQLVLGLDPGPSVLDELIVRRYDSQMRNGLLEEVWSLAARYDLDRESRRAKHSQNQVLQTINYREFFELAAARAKLVAELDATDLASVREKVIEHTQTHSRRQRGWFRKLPRVRMVRNAEQTFSLVKAVWGQPG